MHLLLVKDGCVVALLDQESRPKGMTDNTFAGKDEMASTISLLVLDDTVLFNVEANPTTKGLSEKLKNKQCYVHLILCIHLGIQMMFYHMIDYYFTLNSKSYNYMIINHLSIQCH